MKPAAILLVFTLAGCLALAGEPTPLQLEQALEDLEAGDWILKWAAMTRLARWRVTEAVGPIRKTLDSKNEHPWVRGRALVALARILGQEVLPVARTQAVSSAPELRAAAIEALGIIKAPQARPLILAAMKDPDARVRGQAIVATAKLDGKAAWERVEPALGDKDPTIVRHAARALLYVGTPESRERLIALLDHSEGGVRAEAAKALATLRPEKAIPNLLKRLASDGDERVRSACLKALVAFEPDQLASPMVEAVRAGDLRRCRAALRVLSLRPNLPACDAVARILEEPPRSYRDVLPEALELLARLDPDRYLRCYVKYLGGPTSRVTKAAVACLERCKKADLFDLLRPVLCDKDTGNFLAAFATLRRATTGAPPGGIVEYLSEVLRDGHPRARQAALELIAERITPQEVEKAITLLTPMLTSNEKEARQAAASAIAPAADQKARRRIAAAQGYITRWWLIGPFPRGNRQNKLGPSYFPEHEIDLKKTYEPRAWDPSAQFRQLQAACAGQSRKALLLQPPKKGKLRVLFRLILPDAENLKLTGAAGIQDGARPADGAALEVRADGKTLAKVQIASPEEGWKPFEADLTSLRGKKVAVELLADPLENPTGDQLLVAEPELRDTDQKLLSLLEVADTAPAWVTGRKSRDTLAWARYQVERVDGEVPLYDIFPPPIYDRVAYALCDLEAADEQKAQLRVTADDAFILWHNGRKVAERTSQHESQVELTLRPGRNRLLFKVVNFREWWRFKARMCDPDGRPLHLEH